jgi:hypothetical protein
MHIFFVCDSKTNIVSSFFKMYIYSWHMLLSSVCILYSTLKLFSDAVYACDCLWVII